MAVMVVPVGRRHPRTDPLSVVSAVTAEPAAPPAELVVMAALAVLRSPSIQPQQAAPVAPEVLARAQEQGVPVRVVVPAVTAEVRRLTAVPPLPGVLEVRAVAGRRPAVTVVSAATVVSGRTSRQERQWAAPAAPVGVASRAVPTVGQAAMVEMREQVLPLTRPVAVRVSGEAPALVAFPDRLGARVAHSPSLPWSAFLDQFRSGSLFRRTVPRRTCPTGAILGTYR